MEITYDTQADAIYIRLSEAEFIRNKEVAEGVILDLGEGDALLGIEILEASSRFLPQDLARVDIHMPLNLAAAGHTRTAAPS
ncbi:MAG: DUF2283 domain-containing protein [Dehalococcoidia bacterium]|nr:DUF2283 domain-containing protein [Dehalococcoidia bacterium]